MRKPVLTHPSWYDVEKGTNFIAHQAMKTKAYIDCVVGVARGGLIPAVLFSHIWNVPMIPVRFSAKNGAGDNKDHPNELPPIPYSSILIIDDIADSGETLDQIQKHYMEAYHGSWTAALYHRESAVLTPDFIWQKIPSDAPWICFPWEV